MDTYLKATGRPSDLRISARRATITINHRLNLIVYRWHMMLPYYKASTDASSNGANAKIARSLRPRGAET